MQDQNHQSEKKFEIFEQWHRDKPGQKIYKIHLYMISNMIKAQQKLRQKYERVPNPNPPSSYNIGVNSNNDFDDGAFEPNSHQQHHMLNNQVNGLSRSNAQQKSMRIYEDFKNRGKFQNLKFHFCRQKQRITIIISQNYFINELKCKEFDLLIVYQSFTKIWQEEYLQIMQAFIKYSKQFKAADIIKFEFVAIDILGVTFDISYNNKVMDKMAELKRFRFRYSAFEFRQNPFFEEKNTQQIMSYVEIHSNNISTISHTDFYSSMRLGFIDDINNNSSDLWKRMILRFWVFYQLHCLNRGISDFEEFNKKALGRVHFHSIRMKKFQLIFPFPLLNKSIIDENKEGVIYFTFYLDDKEISISQNGLEFKITVNLVEHYNILTFQQKRQIFGRLCKQDSFSLQPIISKPDRTEPQPNELFEFFMTLKFDDKISRAFAKFETIVSFFVDKVAFNDVRSGQREESDTQKIIEIFAKPKDFKENQFKHTHQLVVQLKHKHSIPLQAPNKYYDEISFVRLYKKKRKYNEKQKKDESNQRVDVPINDDLKRYITQVLRTKPLRECYDQIVQYIEKVVKIIYEPFRDTNTVQRIENRETALSIIITNVMKLMEMGNNHLRKSQITIITQDDPLFMREEHEQDLVAEITFNIQDLKIYWIKRLPEGYIIVRLFQKSIEIIKDLNSKTTIEIDYTNIEKTSEELMKELRNILMKEFATLQNMMI